MTFEVAYCKELDANVTAYKARREFFSQEDSELKYSFRCPDVNCNVEFTSVNVFTLGKFKHKPHFRTWKNKDHSPACTVVLENSKLHDQETTKTSEHGTKVKNVPHKFILSRTSKENTETSRKEQDYDDEGDLVSRNKSSALTRNQQQAIITTSYLENIVDAYQEMDNEERMQNYIELNGESRTYARTFKDIRYCQDGQNYIFYGEVDHIKVYGQDQKNYGIKFKDPVWIDNKPYKVYIYITDELISKYRMRRLFRSTIEEFANIDFAKNSAECFFVGAYPEIKTITYKESTFDVLSVEITNLDHIVFKFKEEGPNL